MAASGAARKHGVPLDVLRAISRTETGRSGAGGLQPWPWTVNMEGTGRWFASRDEARAHVFRHFKRGARSFDVGCFQINYKWHGAAFRSIDDMFDPERNADYAASFLKRLHAELGTWANAAGAYHSRTPKHANRYSSRFERIRATLPETAISASPGWPAPRPGTTRTPGRALEHAPLIGHGTTALGSLVPLVAGSTRPAFIGLDAKDARDARTQP
ncbi:MAG: transglycosylase SLT domain-containing protein [Jhaorihella sp.]